VRFRVETIEHFEKEAKRLIRKFPSLKSEIFDLILELEKNPKIGTSLGNGFYKIRLAIRSKGKGKRGGARVLTFFKITAETVFLVSIYDKSEKSDISDKELRLLLDKISE
jgi:hypothetical protein